MLAGVVSNTAGRADAMSAAVNLLRDRGADFVLHCGDIGGRHVLDELARLEAAFVWGDRDIDRMGLLRYAQKLEVGCFGLLGEFDLDGKRAIVLHGDDRKLLRRLIDEQQYDYLFYGHAADPEDRKMGKTRIIHPGSLHGGATQTCTLVSTSSDEVKILGL